MVRFSNWLAVREAWRRIPLFWRFQLGGWVAFAAFTFPLKVQFTGSISGALLLLILRDGSSFLLSLALWNFYRWAFPRFRPMALFGLGTALAVLGGAAQCGFFWGIHQILPYHDALLFTEPIAFDVFYERAGLLFGWSALYFAIRYMREGMDRELRLVQSENARRESELKMLRAQMDPHFLFNALNTIRSGIDHRSSELIRLVEALSGYLRFSLAHRNDNFVKAGDEFEALADYLTIEKARFRDDLVIDCHFEEAASQCMIPGFLLQPLVENAVKHERKTSPRPLRVVVRAAMEGDLLEMSVANTGTWDDFPRAEPAHGLALENLRHRLAILYPDRQTITIATGDGWVRVTLRIPTGKHP